MAAQKEQNHPVSLGGQRLTRVVWNYYLDHFRDGALSDTGAVRQSLLGDPRLSD